MEGYIPKFEVSKGRTVTCKMGVAHAGAILTFDNFSGDDQEIKGKLILELIKIGALKPVPLTDAEKEAIAQAEKDEKARVKKEAEAQTEREKAEDKAIAQAEKEKSQEKALKEAAILSADFDSMNKDPMIQFAKEWKIELKETKADDIRAELILLKESLKSL